MTRLPEALRAWPSETFKATLKAEIEALGPRGLPLDRAIGQSCYLGDDPVTVSVQQCEDSGDAIAARVAVFFTEILASCGCGGEPMEQNGHCELGVRIDKATAETVIELLDD
jgi:hypothetical protein